MTPWTVNDLAVDRALRRASRGIEMVAVAQIVNATSRLKSVFQDVPERPMSFTEVARVSGVERPLCSALLEALEGEQFVRRTLDGWFVKGARSFTDCKQATAEPITAVTRKLRPADLLRA